MLTQPENETANLGTATYSPDDNKLRFYADSRLSPEDYARAKALGFKWAPRQELFVAPMWTPGREDLLLEWCGEIGDDDSSLAQRAEERADRFDTYSDKRAKDAERAQAGVAAIADWIPMGQPILIGHHSERHARRDADKIRNGMTRAVKMWDTSAYWTQRAAGALQHADRKERPDVRARRIKKIETDRRRIVKDGKKGADFAALVAGLKNAEQVALVASKLWWTLKHEGEYTSVSRLLEQGAVTWEQVKQRTAEGHERSEAHRTRWLAHYDNRLTYEKAMLDEQGASDLLKKRELPKQLPLCNYRAPDGLDAPNQYHRGETIHYPQVEMTKAEYAAIYTDYKGTRPVDRSHRIRTALWGPEPGKRGLVCVFLTDSKVHERPAPIEAKPREVETMHRPADPIPARREVEPDPAAAMRASLKAGVQIAVAPTLFPTPPDLARRMVELAGIEPGHRVLEPSAGTGAIVEAITGTPCHLVAVEINNGLCRRLNTLPGITTLIEADFMDMAGTDSKFDRILMNPPFDHGSDIKHIEHARTMLKPGGRLVAICANGPRQQDKLMQLADFWEDLPAGTFAGTGVRAALLVIEG